MTAVVLCFLNFYIFSDLRMEVEELPKPNHFSKNSSISNDIPTNSEINTSPNKEFFNKKRLLFTVVVFIAGYCLSKFI
jgi:hypothetical protein